MAVLQSPTAVRALILAVILACVAAFTAPTARGSDLDAGRAGSVSDGPTGPSLTLPSRPAGVLLADEWSWREFVKFWERQAGSMTGVLGTVMLVGALAVIMILYKGKG